MNDFILTWICYQPIFWAAYAFIGGASGRGDGPPKNWPTIVLIFSVFGPTVVCMFVYWMIHNVGFRLGYGLRVWLGLEK